MTASHPVFKPVTLPDFQNGNDNLQNATFVTGENIRVDGGVHAGR